MKCRPDLAGPTSIKRAMSLVGIFLGCTGMEQRGSGVAIEYRPGDGIVRAHNQTPMPIRIHYGDVRQPDASGVIFVRFRDRDARLLMDGNPGGWFSPNQYSSQLYFHPRRAALDIPAGGFVDIRLDLAAFAGAAYGRASRFKGPCEVQISVFGYLDHDQSPRRVAQTGWIRGPCPGSTGSGR